MRCLLFTTQGGSKQVVLQERKKLSALTHNKNAKTVTMTAKCLMYSTQTLMFVLNEKIYFVSRQTNIFYFEHD